MCDRDCVPSPERHAVAVLVLVLHGQSLNLNAAARDNEEAAGNGSEDGAPGGGDQGRLEIGEQHPLQGVPGRGPDKGGDAAEADEEEHARFTGRAGRGRGRVVLRSAAAVGAVRVRAAGGWNRVGLCRPRWGCSDSRIVHRGRGSRTSGRVGDTVVIVVIYIFHPCMESPFVSCHTRATR